MEGNVLLFDVRGDSSREGVRVQGDNEHAKHTLVGVFCMSGVWGGEEDNGT